MKYQDLTSELEDDRIKRIGEAVMNLHQKAGVFVDDTPGKADRYIKKLEERFPGIRLTYRGPGTAGSILLKFEPPVV